MAVYLANVGANSSHAARSPLLDDGRFVLMPIPERERWRRPMLRPRDVDGIRAITPRSWLDRAVHLDPDFVSQTPTYGDNCRRAGRAFSLRRAAAGDLIVFMARLHPRAAPAGMYLVGRLAIEDVLADVTVDPGPGWWDGNAHVRRSRASGRWDSFWVFKGGAGSGWLGKAIPFDRCAVCAVFGSGWAWRDDRSELQTIGSYTRAVRRIEGDGADWLRTTCLS